MYFKNELEELEVYLSGKGEPRVHQSDNEDIQEKVSQIKRNIRTIAFGFVKPKQRRSYIRRHQQALTGMLNRVYRLLHPDGAEEQEAQDAFLQTLYAGLEELHGFVKEEYGDCFNEQETVPIGFLLKERQELQGQMEGFISLLAKTRAPKKLVEALLAPYRTLLEGGEDRWSHEKIQWLKRFIAAVQQLPLRAKAGSFYTPLLQAVLYYDLNTTRIKSCLLELILEDVGQMATIGQKIERLSYHHTELNKAPVKKGSPYNSLLPGIKEDLCTYLNKELAYLKAQGGLPAAAEEQQGAKASPATENKEVKESGIYFGLSVEELGLLLAAMKETRMIRNHLTTVSEFLARECRTVGKESFSHMYLYNCVSKKEAKTMASLSDKLIDMVNWLRKRKRM
jgi:hypothetical protein